MNGNVLDVRKLGGSLMKMLFQQCLIGSQSGPKDVYLQVKGQVSIRPPVQFLVLKNPVRLLRTQSQRESSQSQTKKKFMQRFVISVQKWQSLTNSIRSLDRNHIKIGHG